MGEKYSALQYVPGMRGTFENGVLNIECDSLKGFEDIIDQFKASKFKYFWRGQRYLKPLLPTIFRGHKPSDKEIEKHLYQFKDNMTGGDALKKFIALSKKERAQEFEKALSVYYNMIHPHTTKTDPKENYEKDFIDYIYWAIGQHHKLKTPLLDWTKDPYKALFFAFCETKKEDDTRVIFGLAEKTRLLLNSRLPKKRYIEFLSDLGFVTTFLGSSDSPPEIREQIGRMFGRINAQEGLFTRTLNNEEIENYIKKCYIYYKNHRKEEIMFLIRIQVPNKIRKNILETLEGKKITFKTMYPDLEGVALNSNLKLYP